MLLLKLATLLAFLFLPGYLAVSLLLDGTRRVSGAERVFLAAACGCGITALTGMLLGLAGHFGPAALLPIWAVLCGALLLAARRRAGWLARVSWREWAVLALLALLGLALFLPPSRVVFGWSDEGSYPDIAALMEREGDIHTQVDIVAEVAPERRDLLFTPNQDSRVPFQAYLYKQYFITGFEEGQVVPQFYYLWPSLMAVFSLFLGPGRMFYAMTCMALLSLWGIFLMGRRMLGRGWAWVAALLAALSPLMVYFSKYATSEMFTMALFVAACLTLLASPDEDPVRCSPRLAALSAALLFLCFLARIDMYIVLPPLLAVLFWRRVSGGWERADTVFTLLVLAGFTLASLLGYWSSQPYFTSIFRYGLEGAKGVAIVVAAALSVAAAVFFIFPRRLRGVASRVAGHRRLWAILAWVLLAAAFAFLYFLRPVIEGDDVVRYGAINYVRGSTYSTENLIRWAWYFSFPGLLLVFAGYGWAITARGRKSWSLPLAMGIFSTLLYAWDMSCNPLQIMVMRRVVPVIFPLAALMLAWALQRIWEWSFSPRRPAWLRALRPLGIITVSVLVLYLATFNLKASWPILGLEEGGNQQAAVAAVSDAAPDGTVLMDYNAGDLFGPPLLAFEGQPNAWLTGDSVPAEEEFPDLLADLGFPERPVYLLWRPRLSGDRPELAGGLGLEYVTGITWQEENLLTSYVQRPDRRVAIDEPFVLYRIVPPE